MESSKSSIKALSIYELARLNCRERLLVEPLLWTNRHLELLRISFDHSSPPSPETIPQEHIGERSGVRAIRQLLNQWMLTKRESNMRAVFASHDCPFEHNVVPHRVARFQFTHPNDSSAESLDFCFNGRRVQGLTCTCLSPSASAERAGRGSAGAAPVAALVDRERMERLRPGVLRRSTRGRSNKPAEAIYEIRLKRLRPVEPLHDPYIVAVLIALAQRQLKTLREEEDGGQGTEVIIILSSQVLCSSKDKTGLHLYQASISSSFLDMLEHPTIAPEKPQSISIRVIHVPYQPHETLRDRVFALMVAKTLSGR